MDAMLVGTVLNITGNPKELYEMLHPETTAGRHRRRR